MGKGNAIRGLTLYLLKMKGVDWNCHLRNGTIALYR
jgi:hypothetical protein